MQIDVSILFQWAAAGGLVAAITTAVKAYRTLRTGASARQREFVEEQVNRRRQAERELALERRDSSYWQDVAGKYRWQLTTRNILPDPEDPVPPSEKEHHDNPKPIRRKGPEGPRPIRPKQAP